MKKLMLLTVPLILSLMAVDASASVPYRVRRAQTVSRPAQHDTQMRHIREPAAARTQRKMRNEYRGSHLKPAGLKKMPPLRADYAHKLGQRGEMVNAASKSRFTAAGQTSSRVEYRGSYLKRAGLKRMPPLRADYAYKMMLSGKGSTTGHASAASTDSQSSTTKGSHLRPAGRRAMPPIIRFILSLRHAYDNPEDLF